MKKNTTLIVPLSLLDFGLSLLEVVILCEIAALAALPNGCYASNQHIAYVCHCSASKASRTISKLKQKGLIQQISFDGRKRKLTVAMPLMQSSFAFLTRQTCKNGKKEIGTIENNSIVSPLPPRRGAWKQRRTKAEELATYDVDEFFELARKKSKERLHQNKNNDDK